MGVFKWLRDRIIQLARKSSKGNASAFAFMLFTMLVIWPLTMFHVDAMKVFAVRQKLENAVVVSASGALYDTTPDTQLDSQTISTIQTRFMNLLKANLRLDNSNKPQIGRDIEPIQVQSFAVTKNTAGYPQVEVKLSTEVKRYFATDVFGNYYDVIITAKVSNSY